MELLRENEGVPLHHSDFPTLGLDAMVVRAKARDAIRGVVEGYAEFLPLECASADLWVVNVTNVVDGLDEDRSRIVRFTSGRVLNIERFAFRKTVLEYPVFKVPQVNTLFACTDLVQAIWESGLKGSNWRKIWPANKGLS